MAVPNPGGGERWAQNEGLPTKPESLNHGCLLPCKKCDLHISGALTLMNLRYV